MSNEDKIELKPGAIYDIVLTQPLLLEEYYLQAVDHPRCISGKCDGTTLIANRRKLLSVAKREADYLLTESDEVQRLLDRFPCLEDKSITLKRPEE
jgi:hypothetical protein